MKIGKKKTKDSVPLKVRNWARRIRAGKKHGGIRYPAGFKKETLDLLGSGVGAGLLCKSLGISLISLGLWKKADLKRRGSEKPLLEGVRELVIVPDAGAMQERIRIQVGSKVWIEASSAVLHRTLLRELVALGVI